MFWEHWRHWKRWLPLRSYPLRLHSRWQVGHVICEISLRSHRRTPILRLEGLYGFGCADFGPGRRFNTDRGFLLHGPGVIRAQCKSNMRAKYKLTMRAYYHKLALWHVSSRKN